MNLRANARWFVIGGAALAFVGFFLPGIAVKSTAAVLGTEIGSMKETFSLASLADGFTSVFIIPVCFVVTIVLNFIYQTQNVINDQKKIIYYAQWGTLVFGLLFSVYSFFRVGQFLAETSGAVNDSIIGLVGSANFNVTPSFGLFLIILGCGMGVYGLQADGLSNIAYIPGKNSQSSGGKHQAYPEFQEYSPDRSFSPIQNYSSQVAPEPPTVPEFDEPVRQSPVVVAPIITPERAQKKEKISAWLVSKDGKNYQLNAGETTIGRSSSNDIQLSNTRVSKRHAKIVADRGTFKLFDLGSTNGTWLNGNLIRKPESLYSEDTIRFGDSYKVQFVSIKN